MRDEKCFQSARDGMPPPLYIVSLCHVYYWLTLCRIDPYYETVVKRDEEEFIDTTRSRVMFGWEEVYIENGEVLA